MMRLIQISLGIFCWMSLAGGDAIGQSASTDPRREISSVLESQTAAWNAGSIDGFMKGYWNSDTLLFTSGGNVERGWRTALDHYKKSYDSKEKMGKLTFSNIEIDLLSDESAWVFGEWNLARPPDNPGGVFTLIFRKFTDGWKIVHDHTSTNSKLKNQK